MITAMDGHPPYIGWSPTIPRMVTHQQNDGHPLEGSILQTQNLVLRLNIQNKDQGTAAIDGHQASIGWSLTNQRMVTHQNEESYRLRLLQLDLTHKTKTR